VADDYDQPTTVSAPRPSPGVIKMDPQTGNYTMEALKHKVRNVELALIDVQGNTDRRLNAMKSELQGKIDREIQNIGEKSRNIHSETNGNLSVASE
jgi:hypothetical protein